MGSTADSAMEDNIIHGVPPSMYYVPNFITEAEATIIMSNISSKRWVSLARRRLQALPARLTDDNTLVALQGLPTWLRDPVVTRIQERTKAFERAPHGINHCLLNEYLPGQGIMPHEDGAAYYPVVATISLGGSVVLDVTEKKSESGDAAQVVKKWRVLQEPLSLLLTTGNAYTDTLHGIAEVKEDIDLTSETVANWNLLGDPSKIEASGGRNERTIRYSLTFRDVLKVSSIPSTIFGRPRG